MCIRDRLNSIFERITDAFIALDNDWNYTYVNQKAAELHRRERESLIGKNIWSEFPNVMAVSYTHLDVYKRQL